MGDVWTVLVLSLLPGAGNFAGGMAAEFLKASPGMLNRALHAAAGIVLAIVAVELLPEATGTLSAWTIAAAFVAGGLAYIGVEAGLARLQQGPRGSNRTDMWMIYVAVAVDLSADGMMIGSGSAVSSSLAVALAAGQVLADVPEGYATVANLRANNVPRRTRVWLSASFFVFVVGAAVLSYFVLRSAADTLKRGSLVFVAGLLTVAAVEDMLEEAHDAREDTRWSVIAFLVGFALFVIVSGALNEV